MYMPAYAQKHNPKGRTLWVLWMKDKNIVDYSFVSTQKIFFAKKNKYEHSFYTSGNQICILNQKIIDQHLRYLGSETLKP